MIGREAAASLLARALSGAYEWKGFDAANIGALHHAAIDHGVDAVLWDALDGEVRGSAPALRALLEPGVRAALTRDLFTGRDIQAVVAALDGAGVPMLITKGTALAYTTYPQPWLRPRTDTDILVRPDDVARAGRALEAIGYARSDAISTGQLVSHQVAFERTDTHGVHHVVDMHWKIVNPQVVADALSFDELWREAQPAPGLGPSARVPSAIGSLVLGCVHRLAHHQGHDRLIWLYDMKLLTATFDTDDWKAFRDVACSHAVAGFCLDGLRAARQSLGSALPPDIEAALAAAAPAEPSKAYVEGPVTKQDVLWSDLRTLGTWRDRVRLVREHVFPSPAYIQQRYGTHARWLLPALYVHRIVTGAARWAFGSAMPHGGRGGRS